jgi:hypothetical protein
MKKTKSVKITKLMVGDHLKIAGTMYRVINLALRFGRGNDQVRIGLRTLEDDFHYLTLLTDAKTRFDTYTKK